MARQSTTPLNFERTTRRDRTSLYSTGRAGQVVLAGQIPVLRGDSVSGSINIAALLAHMPKPLRNAVVLTGQCWFVPKLAEPKFGGYDEFMASYNGTQQKILEDNGGTAIRDPHVFFNTRGISDGMDYASILASDHFKTLGIHDAWYGTVRVDLFDAYSLAYNFRLAAHSSKLPLRKYFVEDPAQATKFAPAFWPENRFTGVVPDYEQSLILGPVDLRGPASVSIREGYFGSVSPGLGPSFRRMTDGHTLAGNVEGDATSRRVTVDGQEAMYAPGSSLVTELLSATGSSVLTTANIDRAREMQSFALVRQAMAGNDATGFSDDEAILAELMQGFRVPETEFNRPWLLGSTITTFAMVERHATDGASLEESTSQGAASIRIPCNLPAQDIGGYIIYTIEVTPQRLYERQGDPALRIGNPDDLPNALRDALREEPVDPVPNWRVDAKHLNQGALYGYEPMNDKWNRDFTRLGGQFYQETPGEPWTEARSALWMPEIVNPLYTRDHFLVPSPFPHDVFSDTDGPAFEFQAQHDVAIRGLTQIGDILRENNGEYAETAE